MEILPIVRRLGHVAIFLLASVFSIVCATPLVFASSGLITQIGGAAFVQGATQFWVTSARPTFSGITTAGASVSGTVGTQTVSKTADSSGNWSWTPTVDLSGNNAVSLTSGSLSASFTLTIGSLPAGIASSSASTLAPAGTITPTILVLGFGAALTAVGLLGLKITSKPSD